MAVLFRRVGDTLYQTTPSQACTGSSLTFLIAGMRINSQYTVQHRITPVSGSPRYGPQLTYTTGTPSETFPAITVLQRPNLQTDKAQLILYGFIANATSVRFPFATDLAGNVVWYYHPPGGVVVLCRVLPGGNMLMLPNKETTLREIDLAWNTIRETNVANVNAQLASLGVHPILSFNHDAIRLPNGYTVVLSSTERLLTNVQGPGQVDVLGDTVLVLDQNFNVVWAWDAFDHLDTSRLAILGEICDSSTQQGHFCPPFQLAPVANDWLHANSLYYSPSDGNLIVSLRNQDWVIKIDYRNGGGTGNVLWRLGNQGDFTMLNTPNIDSPWFSHQHDVEFEPNGGPGVMSLFDNGNTRRAANSTANSRGQVLRIDEVGKTADIVLSTDLGVFAVALGSAQRLVNGNYEFLAGWINYAKMQARSIEVVPAGSAAGGLNFQTQTASLVYRIFRLTDMYTPWILTSAPTAKAGVNRTANPGTTVKMDGTASNDPNGRPLTYSWSFVSIPAGTRASISNPASIQPTFIPDRAGSYLLHLVVNNGIQNSAPSQVVIVTPNLPPAASAGPNQTVNAGALVSLNGSASVDPNNDPLTYKWSMLSLPAGSGAVLENALSATPSFLADRVGTYVAQLTVTDPSGASASATVAITSNAQPPLANAGTDQTVHVADTVVLSGAASTDPNGFALIYKWSFMSQPTGSAATLQNAASASPSFVADRVGTYVEQLVVNNGYFDSSPATVSVTAQDVPPVANAGMNQVVNAGILVHLDGSGSTDLGGNPLTYQWSLSAPAGSSAVLSDPTQVNPTFILDLPGDYVAQLIVNDGFLTSAPASVTISTVVAAPTAKAGPDQTVNPGTTVLLDGSGSSDPGGLALTYAWSFLSVPAGSTATLSNPASVRPTFVLDPAGNYIVQLVVNNSFLNSAPSTVTVTTNNVAPIANAGANQTVSMGSTVVLSGAASTDANGDPLTYSWSLIALPTGSVATLSNPTSVTPSFVTDQPGIFVAQLIVNDGSLNSTPATVTITTNAVAPVANAGPNQTVNVGSTVILDGSGSTDANGLPLTYHWSLTSIPAGSTATLSNSGAVNPNFTADLGGIYVAQLIANNGLLSSTPATVTVNTNSSPPTANAGPNQLVNVGALVTLDGSGSTDPNGYSVSYSWAFLSMPTGSTATLSSVNTVNPTFVADMGGSYVVQLIVSDPLFSSVPATVTISTNDVAPTANAGPNQSVSRRATVTLDGTGSTGTSHYPLTYKWSFTSRPNKSNATLSDSAVAQPTFVADQSGTYLVQLIVNDGIQNSSPATVTITAN